MRAVQRTTPPVAYACAAVLLVGYLVAQVQASIVFERLMTGEEFRTATRLEAPLLWLFGVALAVGLLAHAALVSQSVRPARPGVATVAVVAAAAFATWYALAVAQWWQIIDSMTVPHTMRRDPTPLEGALVLGLVGAVLVSVAIGVARRSRAATGDSRRARAPA